MKMAPAALAFPTGCPHTGPEFAYVLGALLAEGHASLSQPPATGFFAPQGVAWAPSEHIRHLSRSSRPLVTALGLPRFLLGLRFGRHRGPSRGFEGVRHRYLAALDAGATAGRFTPPREPAPPDPVARRVDILSMWSRTTVDLTSAILRWPDAALDRYQLPHPVLGLLSVRDMLAFTVYHTAHHLRRIMERDAHA
ncbi:MAG: DinB family protein [Gemmatimonadales bacterium]